MNKVILDPVSSDTAEHRSPPPASADHGDGSESQQVSLQAASNSGSTTALGTVAATAPAAAAQAHAVVLPLAQQWHRIPPDLRALHQWMLAGPNDADELKVPTSIDSSGSLCAGSSTNKTKWLSFDEAVAAAQRYGLGIGMAITAEDPFCCIDLDVKNIHNRPESPDLWTSAGEVARIGSIVETLDSYTEISGSGQGAHIWVRANIGEGMKRDPVEVYSQQRFIVCTGNVWKDKAIEDRQEIVDNMVSQMQSASPGARTFELVEVSESDADEVVFDRANRAKNSEKFDALASGDWKGRYPSQSEADLALIAILCFYSKCDSQVRRIFRATGLGKREKASKNNRYLDYCLRRVRSRQAFEEAQRAQYQIDLKHRLREVGEGTLMRAPMPSLTVNEMLKQFVFILARSNVALIDRPTFMAPLSDFRNLTAASFTEIKVIGADGSEKTTRHRSIDLWMNHPDRLMAETVTFDPRHGEFCTDPHGHQALNLYRARAHTAPADWALRVVPFLEHIAFLVPVQAERDRFLDWLSHIEQQPGKLPHSGYLMIATKQGVGRNWMASVFACIWRGHVALDFDLAQVLSSGFNGRLSQKFLAVVDEINEGVQSDQWRHGEKLKSMVTSEVRNINPKSDLNGLSTTAADG